MSVTKLEDVKESGGALTPMEMVDRAISSGAGPEALEKLLSLQERWEAGQARKAFDAALAEMREKLRPIAKKNSVKNAQGKELYAFESLTDVTNALDPLCVEFGFTYRWQCKKIDGEWCVVCILTHRDGHREETPLPFKPDNGQNRNQHQAMGSGLTYLERYTLKMAIGIGAGMDDDAQSAGYSVVEPKPQQQPQPKPRAQPKAKGVSRDLYTELQQDVDSADSKEALKAWATNRKADIDSLPDDWRQNLRDRYADKMVDLEFGPTEYDTHGTEDENNDSYQ